MFTVALDSFKRDFGLEKSTQLARDTLQGNIVSTFQAGTFFGTLIYNERMHVPNVDQVHSLHSR